MNRRLIVVLLLLLSCPGFAVPPKHKSTTIQSLHAVSLSILLNSFDYQESWPPPDKSTESGWLFGVAVRYTYEGGSDLPLWGRAQFDFSPSGTEYGSNETDQFGRSTDFTQNSQDWFSRLEFDAGWVFHKIGGSLIDLIPYTGYGYRFWRREISTHNTLQGYREDYSWSYLPLGLRGELAIDRHWSIGLDVAMRIMVSGQIFIALPQYNSPTLTLGNRPSWHIAIPVEYASASSWGAGLTLWYEYSAIDRSNNSPNVIIGRQYHNIYEPASGTHQFGLAFTGTYHF